MDGYQIFTDATSDLAPELTAGLPSVEMIPMNVEIGGTEYSYGSPEGISQGVLPLAKSWEFCNDLTNQPNDLF